MQKIRILSGLLFLTGLIQAAGPPPRQPMWQRVLVGADAVKASALQDQLMDQTLARKWQEARKTAEELIALREARLGKDHWQSADARWRAAELERVQNASFLKRLSYLGTLQAWAQAAKLEAQGDHAAATVLHRRSLEVALDIFGEDFPFTATMYSTLGYNCQARGKYAEAEQNHRKSLDIYLKTVGELHPFTASSYNNLASTQESLGKYALAEANHRKALAITLQVLGEEHHDTANSYNNLAYTQRHTGQHGLADENFRKALAIFRLSLGEEHVLTAMGYHNLAANYTAQGKYVQAEYGLEKALAIMGKVLGEDHRHYAQCLNSLAFNQTAQRKFAEAEQGYRQALAIRLRRLGKDHPDTASNRHFLAANLNAQHKFAQAEEEATQARLVYRKVYGEEHLQYALLCGQIATALAGQGKYVEAEKEARIASECIRKVFGQDNAFTVVGHKQLAGMLLGLGKYAEAEQQATTAAEIFARVRFQLAAGGLERAFITGEHTPLPLLAILLAHNGKPVQAWQRFEESLARDSRDLFALRQNWSATEQERHMQLLARLRHLDSQLQEPSLVSKPADDAEAKRQKLLLEQLRFQKELAKFSSDLQAKYGTLEGKVLDIASLQQALPADAAFLAWMDMRELPGATDHAKNHWAVLLRSQGQPIWKQLQGTGPGGSWTKADIDLYHDLRTALRKGGDWQTPARKLRALRLTPLADHLQGIRQLIILPSTAVDGLPVEVFAEEYVVSYAMSASLFAAQKQQRQIKGNGLVVLGDPAFRQAEQVKKPLPPGGVLLTVVVPGSPAATSGLKPGDVVLEYGNTPVNSIPELQKAMAAAEKVAAVKVWRLDAKTGKAVERTLQVPRGKLGILVAPEPAAMALAELHRSDARLAAGDNGTWAPLPGTRYEVSALKKLFAESESTVLLGSEASLAKLTGLMKDGTLSRARYVHLATHGEARSDRPLASRVILAPARLQDGQSVDLTAEKVLSEWKLQADLVTLSACQSGLGEQVIGEGLVGFAQTLLLAGSRSVCLSLWSVNDLSTALLMERFYQNLLGKRPGLKAPLGKALALAEAKEWLRTLPRAEALKRAEAIGAGVERAPGAKPLPAVRVPDGTKEQPPYAHPYYWAGFVLVGDRE